MTTKINAMNATGATNAEDALAQSYGPGGLTDQTGVAPDKRVQQFVIFFTDGNPTALQEQFKYDERTMKGSSTGRFAGHANCRTRSTPILSVDNQIAET